MLHDRALMSQASQSAIDRVVAVAAAHADAVDREGRFPTEAIAALREEGLLGAMIPEPLGGDGATMGTLVGYCQRLAGACASTAMIFAMHQIQVACIVMHGLDQDWYEALARRIASDQLLLASITSEVGIGGDMRSSLCAVEIDEDRFTLTKHATTVSYGGYADLFLLTARADREAPASSQVLVTISRGDCTMTATSGWDSLGMRGTCSTGFECVAAGVPDQVFATPFADIAAETMLPVSHLLWGGVWTGIAVAAVTRARKFLRAQARRQPNAPTLGSTRLMQAVGLLESIQSRLAVLIASYDASHALGSDRDVMSEADARWPVGIARATVLNMLKYDASEMCHQAVLHAMLICGMAGYKNDTEFSVGRHLRDILSAQLMINNDRVAANTGALLFAQRSELGRL